jgi:hypothetical protein
LYLADVLAIERDRSGGEEFVFQLRESGRFADGDIDSLGRSVRWVVFYLEGQGARCS